MFTAQGDDQRLVERLLSFSGALGAARTPQEIAEVTVTTGAEALGACTASFFKMEDGELVLVAQHGLDPRIVETWRRYSVELATPVGLAYRERTPQFAETRDDVIARFPAVADTAPDGGLAAFPLVVRDDVRGVVAYRFGASHAFSEHERSLLSTVATQAAQALDRASAHERLAILVELSDALSKTVSIGDVARVVLERGTEMTRADTCTLYSFDDATRVLELVGERGVSAEIVERIRFIRSADENPIYATTTTARAMYAETLEEYASIVPSIASMPPGVRRAQAFFAVPLVAEGRPVGLLGMGFYRPHHFPPDARALIAAFSRQCAEAMLRALRLERERTARAGLATTLRSIGDAVIATDARGAISMMNPVAEALTKWHERDARGRPLPEVFHILNEETRAIVQNPVEKVLEHGAVVGLANHTVLVARDGTELPIEDSAAPIRATEDAAIGGVVLVFRDATQKSREERRRAFLADATAALAESLDYEVTLGRVAELAVPTLADWCAVDLVSRGAARPKRVAVTHVDPAKVQLARDLHTRYPADPGAQHGLPNVLRTGRSELIADIPDELLAAIAQDEAHYRVAKELGLRSAMIVPLAASGRILGAMSFVMAESGRRYTEDDLLFAEDLARRFATAIENAELFEAEQRARRNADVANQAKDEFLAVVSHELRTPLNAILGWAKLMSAQAFDESHRDRAVATITRNSIAMTQLIEDLLDMSRIVSGKMRLEVEPVALDQVVLAALDTIRPAADAKDIHVATRVAEKLPPLFGDGSRLQQVAWNLLSNAVKFTPRGGRVEVTLRAVDSSIEIEVTDDGAGISPQFVPHVFDAFRQEDARSTRSRGGLGLGLAITKQLVELHGGHIEARSDGEGRGATFLVHLPLRDGRAPRVDPPKPDVRVVRKKPAELGGLRVLVVDDDRDARELAALILEECGASVRVASSVEEALAGFGAEPPDVLLADISMPDRDGLDLIRAVRALPPERGRNVPAAAMTAYARAEDRQRILDAGYWMHLAKPIDPNELTAVVASLTQFRSSP